MSEFMAGTSAAEVSVSEHGRRRFELNPSSMWEGVQSVTCDFIDNKLAAVTVLYATDSLWLNQMSQAVAARGQPSTWPALTGTTLYERKVVEESAAWVDDKSMLAMLREASSSGTRLMVVLMTRARFDTMTREGTLPGAGRQMLSVNLATAAYQRLELRYARAFTPSVAGLVDVELGEGNWFSHLMGEQLAGFGTRPGFAASVGAQWYPASGGAPKGFFLEAKGRLAVTSSGYYSGVAGGLGYNFIFASGLAVGLSAGVSYMPDRGTPTMPIGSLDIGWAP